MSVVSAAVGTGSDNPFPGLRPFEQDESALFFGRDEQCDDLLARLARRRLVAVVGMSGSGKSSLVRAGLLPALDRGYIPSAGSSWHVAIFRPGSDPLANLTRALAARRRPAPAAAGVGESAEQIRELLDSSSLGLAAAARRLLTDRADTLLVVADQFEELFRFRRIAPERGAREQAAACVDLLISAVQQDEVPVYVVLTMRSDYLGDCAHFTGLPEALSDSQFLVPRMTRAQLRAAIESPIAVCGARIAPRLVQRLLYDVDGMSSSDDQLPVLQHALMRMWEVSRADRERGDAIDLRHYEQPPVETLRYALDRHAEEVYRELPSDRHREVARLVFQQLTDRDAENRDVRRPTPFGELAAVALRRPPHVLPADGAALVNEVLAPFAAEGRAFVVVNAQRDVDISHESFIRKWERLRQWVDEENRSRRIYTKVADAAAQWDRSEGSLYRGPELAEARRWWQQQRPTQLWADRYDARLDVAERFLARSVRSQRVRRGLLFGNIALLVVGAVVIAVLMAISRQEARRAEEAARRAEVEALNARNATETSKRELADANRLFAQALEAQKKGETARAADLEKQASQVQQQATARPSLTPSELSELDRLRTERYAFQKTEADLRQQIATLRAGADLASSDRADLDRLRKAEAGWKSDVAQLQQQITALNDRIAKLQQSETSLTRSLNEAQARLAASGGGDAAAIEQLLRDYRTAYERLDAGAVVKLMPSASINELTRSFGQLKAYGMEMSATNISVDGDTAVVKCIRRIAVQPKVGSPPAPQNVPTVFRLRRTGGAWTIESVGQNE